MYSPSQSSINNKLTIKEKIFSLDFKLILTVFLIGLVSCFAMYSTDNGSFGYHTISHIYRFSLFFLLFILFSFVRISFWFKYSYIFYFLFFALLISVEFFGLSSSGSKRWISLYLINLQPSELMKVGIILYLAKYYHKLSSGDVNKLKYLLQPLIIIIVPIFLVLRQPDLGTALLIAFTGVVIIWLAGLKVKYFAYMFTIFIIGLPIIIAFLKPYQKLRILTFLDPDRDPLGSGYQIIQSKIAVGSGGLLGKGYLKGTQSYLDYLPEKHTDFIFTLFSEEFGFLGSSTLLFLYACLIFLIARIGLYTKNSFSKFYCFGLATAIFIYVTVNMCMVLGLLPIVGSPLPFMSYGGSSMLAMMFGLSVAMSAKIYQKQHLN